MSKAAAKAEEYKPPTKEQIEKGGAIADQVRDALLSKLPVWQQNIVKAINAGECPPFNPNLLIVAGVLSFAVQTAINGNLTKEQVIGMINQQWGGATQ